MVKQFQENEEERFLWTGVGQLTRWQAASKTAANDPSLLSVTPLHSPLPPWIVLTCGTH